MRGNQEILSGNPPKWPTTYCVWMVSPRLRQLLSVTIVPKDLVRVKLTALFRFGLGETRSGLDKNSLIFMELVVYMQNVADTPVYFSQRLAQVFRFDVPENKRTAA